jgi:hypothetical protein
MILTAPTPTAAECRTTQDSLCYGLCKVAISTAAICYWQIRRLLRYSVGRSASTFFSGSLQGKHNKYKSLDQSPSWEANRSTASQQITLILCYLKVHYRIHKTHPRPYLEPDQSSTCPHLIYWRSIFISPHLCLGLPSGFLTSCPLRQKPCTHLSPARATCPANLILHDLITRYLMSSTDH